LNWGSTPCGSGVGPRCEARVRLRFALENADLYTRLHDRSVELARLSARMIEQHEEERRRLSRELHDETAQVFSAVKMELGLLRDGVGPAQSERLDNPPHRPSHQRRIADQTRSEALSGEHSGKQPHRGARVAAVDVGLRRGEPCQADAVH